MLVVGSSLQYRLWYLWPLVIAIAYEHRREISRTQFAAADVVAAASLVTFGLSVPFVSKFHDIPKITPNPLVLTHGVHGVQGAALVAGCLVVAIALRYDRPIAAAWIALALVLVFAVDQSGTRSSSCRCSSWRGHARRRSLSRWSSSRG